MYHSPRAARRRKLEKPTELPLPLNDSRERRPSLEHPALDAPRITYLHEPRSLIRVEYRTPGAPERSQRRSDPRAASSAGSPPHVLAAVGFGKQDLSHGAPLVVDVRLTPLQENAPTELWLASGPVQVGRVGHVRYAHDEHLLFAVVELDEREYGGIRGATEAAYAAIRDFQAQTPFPHLLRMWNYLDAINEGDGDQERYRQFCVGRALGLGLAAGSGQAGSGSGRDACTEPGQGFGSGVEHGGGSGKGNYPAATAIGRQHTTHQLLVYWLAGRLPGRAVENPRQVSAYRYPRAHGPVSPNFSRATVAPDGTILISGTASIVGHVSRHHDQPMEQLEETLRNLAALGEQAARPQAPDASRDLLKVYVRDPAHASAIAARVRQAYPSAEAVLLAADVCRRELLVEIECLRRVGESGVRI